MAHDVATIPNLIKTYLLILTEDICETQRAIFVCISGYFN